MLGWFVLSFIVVNFIVGIYTFFRYDYKDHSCLNLVFCSFSGIISFLMEIKNKVKDMKAKDLGTQKFNKEVHQPSIQQLERKSKSLASTVDYEAEFVSLSTTGTLPRLEVQDKVRIPQTI